MERARAVSLAISLIALAAWAVTLGGLGALNVAACRPDVQGAAAVVRCSRQWSWCVFCVCALSE